MIQTLDQLPVELLNEIVYYLAISNRDVFNFSFLLRKSIRDELMEINHLVLSIRIASDIRKLADINCKRMQQYEKKEYYEKPKPIKKKKTNPPSNYYQTPFQQSPSSQFNCGMNYSPQHYSLSNMNSNNQNYNQNYSQHGMAMNQMVQFNNNQQQSYPDFCRMSLSFLMDPNPNIYNNPNIIVMNSNKRSLEIVQNDDEEEEYEGYKKVKTNESFPELISRLFKDFESHKYDKTVNEQNSGYRFEKWLTKHIEQNLDQAKRISHVKTTTITKTDKIKNTWSRLLNGYLYHEHGEEVCQIISKHIYQQVEYILWEYTEEDDSVECNGTFNIGNEKFRFESCMGTDDDNEWGLYPVLTSWDGNSIVVDIPEFNRLKEVLFGGHVKQISNDVFLLVLLSLIDFEYTDCRANIKQVEYHASSPANLLVDPQDLHATFNIQQ